MVGGSVVPEKVEDAREKSGDSRLRELLRAQLEGKRSYSITLRGVVATAISSILVLWAAWVSTDILSMERNWAMHGEPAMTELRTDLVARQRSIDRITLILEQQVAATRLNGRKISDMAFYHFGSEVQEHRCVLPNGNNYR